MNENKQLYRFSYQLGDWFMTFIKLHFFCLMFIIKGGIFLGIFPAVSTVFHYFWFIFQKKERPQSIYPWFKKTYASHFRVVNQLGYILSVSILFLWIDLRISSMFLQNRFLHFILTFIFVISLLIGIYLFPVYLRYSLSKMQYFKVAFLLMMISIPQTIAIILAVFIASVVATVFPILVVTAFIPMVIFPISWFTFQAIQRAEHKGPIPEPMSK